MLMLRASKCNLCYFTTFLMYFSILKLGVILLCMCLCVCMFVCVRVQVATSEQN